MNGHDDPGFSALLPSEEEWEERQKEEEMFYPDDSPSPFQDDELRAEEKRQSQGWNEEEPSPARCGHYQTWPLPGGKLLRCYRCAATIPNPKGV